MPGQPGSIMDLSQLDLEWVSKVNPYPLWHVGSRLPKQSQVQVKLALGYEGSRWT